MANPSSPGNGLLKRTELRSTLRGRIGEATLRRSDTRVSVTDRRALQPLHASSSLEADCKTVALVPLKCVDPRIHYYDMEPEYVPSESPDLQRPGVVYFEASLRPSCYRLADATCLRTSPPGSVLELVT